MNKGNGIQSPLFRNEGNGLEYFINRGVVYCFARGGPHGGTWKRSCFTPLELLKYKQFVLLL